MGRMWEMPVVAWVTVIALLAVGIAGLVFADKLYELSVVIRHNYPRWVPEWYRELDSAYFEAFSGLLGRAAIVWGIRLSSLGLIIVSLGAVLLFARG